jgi:SPP1 family predicted phage head-tail adaptor
MRARKIAAMRLRFVIEAPVESATLLGGAMILWQAGATFWGRIEARAGREANATERMEGRVETRISTRFRDGLLPGHRLRVGARLFEIRAVFDPDGARRDLVILADEVVT